jgi:ABC-type branched-subunit amino acid transport system substrate-binding protein
LVIERSLLNKKTTLVLLFILIIGLPLVPERGCPAGPLTPQERRGKEVYLKGISSHGNTMKAFVGEEGAIKAPASAMPCVNCHGRDGKGLDEAGIAAPDITWERLTRPYTLRTLKGREHPPYTEETLGRAIREAIDPAGDRMEHTMPRYEISEADLQDLIAYLKVIATAQDPGLSQSGIRVGSVLPLKGPLAELGQAMKAVMEAYFTEINRTGGIYGRQIELQVVEYAGVKPAIVSAFEKLIEDGVFAIVGGVTSGADTEISALVEVEEIPLIGPFTLYPEDIQALNRFTFYLFSGMREQARVLVSYAGERFEGAGHRVAVIYPEEENALGVVEGIEKEILSKGWRAIEKAPYATGRFDAKRLSERLSQGGTEALFFLGPWDLLSGLLNEAARLKWTPLIFASGSHVQRGIFDAPPEFSRKIFLAYSTLPVDHSESGMRELGRLFEKHNLTEKHLAAQISAYCAAKILVEGMKRAGRNLSREKLLASLEKLYELETGLTRPITYDSNRRIGAMGAYVVTVDLEKKQFVPVSKWIPLQH